MKNILRKKMFLQYSIESISAKSKKLYFLVLLIRIILFSPLLYMILINTLDNQNNKFFYLVSIVVSIMISALITKKEVIQNPLFLDDEVVISSKTKQNGEIEDVTISKFNILVAVNLFCIIPLCFIFSLTISTIIFFVIKIFLKSNIILQVIRYILVLIFLHILLKNINDTLINFLRKSE